MIDLKTTFNQDAEAYNKYRPHYPATLLDTLVEYTHLSPSAELLEIGPGTGQATADIAARGYYITGIELGEHLASKAREVLKPYSNVKIVAGAFEDADLPAGYYDLIYAATAFHWIRESAKFTKTANLLKDGGYLAIIHTEHVSDEHGDEFFKLSHPIYQKYQKNVPHTEVPALPHTDELAPRPFDVDLFDFVHFASFPYDVSYTAEEYCGLIGTYSPNLALPPATRARLFDDIRQVITEKFGGNLVRHFAMTLTILQKR
jgi:SAM-dependent methyltransferase